MKTRGHSESELIHYFKMHTLAENWPWAQDVNGRDCWLPRDIAF